MVCALQNLDYANIISEKYVFNNVEERYFPGHASMLLSLSV